MTFVKDIYRDEIRDGWLVKSGIKKAWNTMLEMWQEVDRICHKYNLKYWAYAGTLLGAVRHKGFIPWDTDMDLCMLRPDYNIFCDAVERELLKKDGIFEVERANFNNFRIGMNTTTMLAKDDIQGGEPRKTYGMLIEVYPLDIAPDDTPKGNYFAAKILELLNGGNEEDYPELKKRAEAGERLFNDWQVIENFHSLPEEERQTFYRKYSALLFDKSTMLGTIEYIVTKPERRYPREIFDETIYLPFEEIKMPVPAGYEKILETHYGDWHKFVYDHTFRIGSLYSTDIPYKEFFEQANFDLMFPPEDEDSTEAST